MRRPAATLALAAVLAAGAAVPADAAGVNVSGVITGGASLSVAPNGTPSFSVTLNGADQSTTYTLPVELTDPRGNGAGWNLTVTSTQFADGSGHTFPVTASTITTATSGCATGSTCTTPTNGISYGTSGIALPAGSTPPTATKYFDAAVGTGLGKIDVNATVSVTVPANVYAGTYSSTVTVAAVSGP